MADPLTPDAPRLLRLSRAAVRSLGAVMVADLLALCTEFFYVGYLRSLSPDTNVSETDLAASEAFDALAGLLQMAALIVAAVLFIKWFRLAYVHVTSITGRATAHSSRWAIWGFFVPLLNLIRPQNIMREIWDTAEVKWLEADPRVAGRSLPADSVNLWWGFFLGSMILSNVAARRLFRATTAEQTLNATILYMLADGVDVVAAALAILLVRRVTELQLPLVSDDGQNSTPKTPSGSVQ
jgi:hypothetical protein